MSDHLGRRMAARTCPARDHQHPDRHRPASTEPIHL